MRNKLEMPQAPQFHIVKNATCELVASAFARFDIRQQAADGSDSISLYGIVGETMFGDGNNTVKRVSAALRSINGPATVNINSPGGNFWEGLAIYNTLRNYPHKITVQIVGMAASVAAIIAMAGDEINIAQSAFMMIHNTQLSVDGDRHTLREAADVMETFDEAAADIFAVRTGMRARKISEMLDKETWISANDAVKQGFADNVSSQDKVVTAAVSNALPRYIEAANSLDKILAKANMSRSERRKLLQDYKTGKQDAANLTDTHDAVANILENALKEIKTMGK